MHAACFDKCEQALVGSMRHSVHLWLTRQVKDMSDDEICSTLWTSNYDRLCRTQCKCQCGAGFFKCVTQKSESSAGVGHKTRAAPTEVATPVANRHYAATVPNGGKVSLTFAEGFCVYVVYLTSEPASPVDFGGD